MSSKGFQTITNTSIKNGNRLSLTKSTFSTEDFEDKNFHTITATTGSIFHDCRNLDEEYVTRLNYFNPNNPKDKNNLYYLNTYQAQMRIKKLPKLGEKPKRIEVPDAESKNDKEFGDSQMYKFRTMNMLKEEELEKKRKELGEEIQNYKSIIEIYYAKINEIDDLISDRNLELEVLKNLGSYKNFIRETNTRTKKGGGKDSNEFELKLNYQRKMQGEMGKIKEKRNIKENEILSLLNDKELLRKKIKELESTVKEIKEKYNAVRQDLLVHYHKILSEGKDTRNEGLIWVIKAIWNLNSNVMLMYLPTFLDDQALIYLFEASKKSQLLKEMKENLQLLKNEVRKNAANFLNDEEQKEKLRKANQINFNDTNSTFKTSLYNTGTKSKFFNPNDKDSDKENKCSFSKNWFFSSVLLDEENKAILNKFKKKDNNAFSKKRKEKPLLTINNVGKLLENKINPIDPNLFNNMLSLNELSEKIRDFYRGMNDEKRKELSRLNKEFYLNDYAKRFNVSQETVISAIIGEDFTKHELFIEQKEQKAYFNDLKKIRIGNQYNTEKQNFNYNVKEEDPNSYYGYNIKSEDYEIFEYSNTINKTENA